MIRYLLATSLWLILGAAAIAASGPTWTKVCAGVDTSYPGCTVSSNFVYTAWNGLTWNPVANKIIIPNQSAGGSIYANTLFSFDDQTHHIDAMISGSTSCTPTTDSLFEERHFYNQQALDSSRNRLYFGGGSCSSGFADFGYIDLTNNTWHNLAAITGPPANQGGTWAYDVAHDAILAAGQNTGNFFFQVWVYCETGGGSLSLSQSQVCSSASTWQQVTVAGTPPDSSQSCSGDICDKNDSTMVWDSQSGLYIYVAYANTYTATWTSQLHQTWTNRVVTPVAEDMPAVAISTVSHIVWLHGISGATNQDWYYDPASPSSDWVQTTSNIGPSYACGYSPTMHMAFDPVNNLMVVKQPDSCVAPTDAIWVGTMPFAPTITSASPLTDGAYNVAYSPTPATLTATGRPSTFTWSVLNGQLPSGLVLNSSTGAITGAPNTPLTDAAGRYKVGLGGTTAECVDVDNDGYGVGPWCLGPDADDTDPAVHTTSQALAAHGGSLATFWNSYLGYTFTRVFYVGDGGSCTAVTTPYVYDATKSCGDIASAMIAMSAGDALVGRGGTYVSTDLGFKPGTWSGTSCTATSYYLAYPGERPVNTRSSGDGWSAPDASDGCWVVDGWTIVQTSLSTGRGLQSSPFPESSHANHGVIVSHNDISGFNDNIALFNKQEGTRVKYNYVHDAFSSGDGHDIYFAADVFVDVVSTGGIIYGNVFARADGLCIHLNGEMDGILVDSNVMYGCVTGPISLQSGVANSTVQNNVSFSSHGPAFQVYDYTFEAGNVPLAGQCKAQTGNTIRNNIFYEDGKDYTGGTNDAGYPAIMVQNTNCPGPPDLGHNFYYNNILAHACGSDCNNSGGGSLVEYQNGSDGVAWLASDTYKNNLGYKVDTPTQIVKVNSVYQNCAWFTTPANVPGSGNICGSDPLFVAANPDWFTTPGKFMLNVNSGSPVLGAAYSASVPSFDLTGMGVLAAPSIGAYAAGRPITNQFTLKASNGISPDATALFSLTVTANCTIGTASLPGAIIGVPYSQALNLNDCAAPTCSVSIGTLPSGLALSGTGNCTISGTPVDGALSSTFNIAVSDANGNPTKSLFIAVSPTPAPVSNGAVIRR